MIFGRPTNLWLGFATTLIGFGGLVAVNVVHADPVTVATLTGGLTLLSGAAISLVAGRPPTVNEGDTINVKTPDGQPNTTLTV